MTQPPTFRAFFAIFGTLFYVGCEIPTSATPSGASSDSEPGVLLSYQGPVRGLFDDGIDSEVFGNIDDQNTLNDHRLAERVRSSGLIVVVRVTTVSDEGFDATGRLEIDLSPVEAPILGSVAAFSKDGDSIRLALSTGTVSYSLLRSNQNDLIGKRLILCVGRFIDQGKPVVHWHAMADSPKVRTAVNAAASVAELVQ